MAGAGPAPGAAPPSSSGRWIYAFSVTAGAESTLLFSS